MASKIQDSNLQCVCNDVAAAVVVYTICVYQSRSGWLVEKERESDTLMSLLVVCLIEHCVTTPCCSSCGSE